VCGHHLKQGQAIEGLDESRAVNFVLDAGQTCLHLERTVHRFKPNRSAGLESGFAFLHADAGALDDQTANRDGLRRDRNRPLPSW
jgi:hypothetical protein